jgi:predicted transglutaminase-like cysteine proteinase
MGRSAFSFVIAGLLLAGAVTLAEARGPFMNLGRSTDAPKAFYSFCGKYPAECARRNSAAGKRIALTPNRWAELKRVNRQVNRSVREVSDLMNFGRKDVWQLPAKKGDCEDFALLKRQRLIALGWPSSALLMTVVRDRRGEGHAVLTVVTDKGDYVLDNMTGRIKLWSATPYIYFSRQSQSNPRIWVSVTTDVQRLLAEGRR